MLITLEILDGIGAGILSVAGPAAIADLTYGGGRTQTAMGGVQTIQSLASAGSALAGGYLVHYFGWAGAFGGLAIFPLLGIGLLLTIPTEGRPPSGSRVTRRKSGGHQRAGVIFARGGEQRLGRDLPRPPGQRATPPPGVPSPESPQGHG